MEIKHVCWRDVAIDSPVPLLERKKLVGEHCLVANITLFEGCIVPRHCHASEQISFVMSGCLRFEVSDLSGTEWKQIDVQAGEVLCLPANTPHGAVALVDTVVLDVLSPVSAGMGIDQPGIASSLPAG